MPEAEINFEDISKGKVKIDIDENADTSENMETVES